MDKTLSAHTTFVKAVDQLRNTECSDKQKIHLFQEISETITSPALGSYVNFSRHCGSAVSVLLLFSEDLDHNVRIKAEENLYRIIRHLQKHRLNRLLMDLYGEIKKNGNERENLDNLSLWKYKGLNKKQKLGDLSLTGAGSLFSSVSQQSLLSLLDIPKDLIALKSELLSQGIEEETS